MELLLYNILQNEGPSFPCASILMPSMYGHCYLTQYIQIHQYAGDISWLLELLQRQLWCRIEIPRKTYQRTFGSSTVYGSLNWKWQICLGCLLTQLTQSKASRRAAAAALHRVSFRMLASGQMWHVSEAPARQWFPSRSCLRGRYVHLVEKGSVGIKTVCTFSSILPPPPPPSLWLAFWLESSRKWFSLYCWCLNGLPSVATCAMLFLLCMLFVLFMRTRLLCIARGLI